MEGSRSFYLQPFLGITVVGLLPFQIRFLSEKILETLLGFIPLYGQVACPAEPKC